MFVSVECFEWQSYIAEPDCIELSLINNKWSTQAELAEMSETDIKNLLLDRLKFYYDGFIHSIVDLSMREVTGDKGSLCGMAAMYQAASQTILTISQIKQMSFNDVKVAIGLELLYDSATAKKQKDLEIIGEYYSCKNIRFIIDLVLSFNDI